MSARGIIGIVAVAGVIGFGMVTSMIANDMVDKVNAQLSSERRFSLLFWYAPKTLRLWGEYRRLFPSGKLLRAYWAMVALACGCLLCAGWAIGLF